MKGISILMRMVRKSGVYFSLIAVLLIVSCVIVFAESNYPSGSFEVNTCYADANKTKQNKLTIWKCFRSWGFSEQATAGIMGNIAVESGFDPSRTEGNKSWETVKSGVWAGIGLCQWSGPHPNGADNRRNKLWEISKNLNKPWTAMECNLKMIYFELFEGGIGNQWWKNGFGSVDEFKKSTDTEKCCQSFYTGFEMQCTNIDWALSKYYSSYKTRPSRSKEIYEEFKGTDYSDFKMDGLDGTFSSADDSSKDSSSKSSGDGKWVDNEMDLVGMSKYKESLKDKQEKVKMPTADDLTVDESYSLNQVREGITSNNQMNMYQFVRVLVTFIGLCLVFYSVLMLVSLMFDRSNTFFDFSMIGIITFGLLSYSNDYLTKHKTGYSGTQRIIVSIVVILVVGLILISGGVFSFLSYIIYSGISGLIGD